MDSPYRRSDLHPRKRRNKAAEQPRRILHRRLHAALRPFGGHRRKRTHGIIQLKELLLGQRAPQPALDIIDMMAERLAVAVGKQGMIVLADKAFLIEFRVLLQPAEHSVMAFLPGELAVDPVQRPAAKIIPNPLNGAEDVLKIDIERRAGNAADTAYVTHTDFIRITGAKKLLNGSDDLHPGIILPGHAFLRILNRVYLLYRF